MKIYTAGVVGRYFEPDNVMSVLRWLPACAQATGHPPIYRPKFNDALICRARSRVAYEFLQSDADVLLSIDSDISFNPEDALAICQGAMDHDLVGGQYVTRNKTTRYCYPTSLVDNGTRVVYAGDHELVKAKYISGGFVAVHRRVFEGLIAGPKMPLLHKNVESMSFYPFYQPFWTEGENETIYLSEDWALCERARRAGFGVWLDPGVRLQHIGLHPFRLEDMLQESLPTQEIALTRQAGGQYLREAPSLVERTVPGD